MEKYSLYDGEIELTFDPKNHLYQANGKRAHGVTSILATLAKPALIYWAANKAAEYVLATLKAGEVLDELQIQELANGAKTAHRQRSKEAADIGTLAHNWISSWIKGENPKPLVNERAKAICDRFVQWVEERKVTFLMSERKIYSRKYGYAGTCDFVAQIGEELWVGDIKTANSFYDEQLWQCSAYRHALEEELGTKFAGRIIVRCGKDGSFEEVEKRDEHEEDFDAFLGLLRAYGRQQVLRDEKRAKSAYIAR